MIRVVTHGPVETTFVAPLQHLQTVAKSIRDVLSEICFDYLRKPPAERECDSDAPRALQTLARLGHVFRENFFKDAAVLERGKLVDRHSSVTFILHRGSQVHLPWALMFDLPQGVTRAGRSTFEKLSQDELRAGFWGMQRKISAMYRHSDTAIHPPPPTKPRSNSRLVAVFNTEAARYAEPNYSKGWPSAYDSLDAFLDFVSTSVDPSWLMYFFCHADARGMYFGIPGDVTSTYLPPQLLDAHLRGNAKTERHGLLFLNGCQTATTKKPLSWQEVSQKHGLDGCIATEAVVPTLFAWRFGRDFIYQLTQGLAPEDAMAELRPLHWPLSLLYGLYCVPDAVLRARIPRMLPPPQRVNYCQLPLGSVNEPRATLPFVGVLSATSERGRRSS